MCLKANCSPIIPTTWSLMSQRFTVLSTVLYSIFLFDKSLRNIKSLFLNHYFSFACALCHQKNVSKKYREIARIIDYFLLITSRSLMSLWISRSYPSTPRIFLSSPCLSLYTPLLSRSTPLLSTPLLSTQLLSKPLLFCDVATLLPTLLHSSPSALTSAAFLLLLKRSFHS